MNKDRLYGSRQHWSRLTEIAEGDGVAAGKATSIRRRNTWPREWFTSVAGEIAGEIKFGDGLRGFG
jgi:hypothetical protein